VSEYPQPYGNNTKVLTHTEKCISVQQPFASLIVDGRKLIEFRSWRTNFRGRVAIHASKGKYRGKLLPLLNTQITPYQTGSIIGFVQLVDCRSISAMDEELALVRADGYRFSWIFEKPKALVRPIEAIGRLGLYNISLSLENCNDETD
jgi:hypothetical protein